MSGSFIQNYISGSPFAAFIQNTEQSLGIPSGLLGAQLYQESTLGTQAGNGGGIGQFIPSTAAQYGINVNDPYSGISGAGTYLTQLYNKLGSWTSSLQAYGTLPKDLSGNLTAGQQYVLGIAQQADGTAGAAGNSSPSQTEGGTTSQTSAASGAPTWGTWLLNQLGVGSLSNFALRLFVFFIVLVLVFLGVADLAFGMSPKQAVRSVAKGVEL